MIQLGDIEVGGTLHCDFDTFDSAGGSVTITGLAVTDIEIYKDGSMTQRASDNGYFLTDTDGIDVDGKVGIHGFEVDLSDNSDAGFFAAGSYYRTVVDAVTIDGETVRFSFANTIGKLLRPTTAGRTLDVTATGAAGLDWGNIENKATANDLSGTDIQLVDTTTANTDMLTAAAVNAEVDTALGDYDGPTKAEMDTGHGLLATEAKQDINDANVVLILADTAVIGPLGAGLTDLGGMSTAMAAEVRVEAAGALADINLDHLLQNATAIPAITAGTFLDQIMDDGTATFNRATDSLQAIRDRGDAQWATGAGGSDPMVLLSTTISSLTFQNFFNLTAGAPDNNAYNDCVAVITDASDATQKAVAVISDYAASGNLLTLVADPGIFTFVVGDRVDIIADRSLKPNNQARRLDMDASGFVQMKPIIHTGATIPNLQNHPDLLISTTIDVVVLQTAFSIVDGSDDDDAYNDHQVVVTKAGTPTQKATGIAFDYTGSTKTLTLYADPGIFTMAAGDKVEILADRSLKPDGLGVQLALDSSGRVVLQAATHAGAVIPTVTTVGTTTTNTDMRGTDSANTTTPPTVAAITADIDANSTKLISIEGDTQNIQTRLPAALTSGRMDANLQAMNDDTESVLDLAASAKTIVRATVDTVTNTHTPTTTEFQADITEATADHYEGRSVMFTSGVLKDQPANITAYALVGGIGQFTVTAMTDAPSDDDTFNIV